MPRRRSPRLHHFAPMILWCRTHHDAERRTTRLALLPERRRVAEGRTGRMDSINRLLHGEKCRKLRVGLIPARALGAGALPSCNSLSPHDSPNLVPRSRRVVGRFALRGSNRRPRRRVASPLPGDPQRPGGGAFLYVQRRSRQRAGLRAGQNARRRGRTAAHPSRDAGRAKRPPGWIAAASSGRRPRARVRP